MAIKVLHILNKLNPSGAEVMLEIAADYWIKRGVEGDILSTDIEIGKYEDVLNKSGYSIFHIALNPYINFIKELVKFLRNSDYDIIHIHSEGASLFTAIAARIAKKKIIIRTVHHIWPRQNILPFIKRYIYRFISNKVLGVVAVSNSISGLRNEEHYFHAYNKLIPNWYDDQKFNPVSDLEKLKQRKINNISENEIIVTSLGGNWPYKNYYMIIEALSKLPRDSKIRYFQIGPDVDGNPLEKLVNKLNVSSRVTLFGRVDNVLPILQMSDYYIMPSSEEGFGNAAIEAMSVGLKPILSDVKALCDFKDYYSESDIIWIQPSIKEIVRALTAIENFGFPDEEFRNRLYEVTKNNFGMNVGAAKYYELYKQLIR